MLAGFKSKNHPQQIAKSGARDDIDDRRTPAEVFDPLHARYGFTLDAAASRANAKCARYFTRRQDGLRQSWKSEVVWCNPPYSNLGAWCEKASQEVLFNGCKRVVMLLPANRTEQSFWQQLIEPFRDRADQHIRTKFLKGRIRFGRPRGTPIPIKGDRPPFGLVLVTFAPPRRA